MKILIDLTSLADNLSGIERYAMNIAKKMIDVENDKKVKFILVFKNKIHSMFIPYVNTKNVECRVLKGNKKLLFNQVILPFSIYREKADKYIFLAFPSPILFRKKGIYNMIADLTCWDCPETMNWKSRLFFRVMIRNAIHVSDGIITISNFTKQRILDKFKNIKKPIIVAYCGISDIFLRHKNYSESDKISMCNKYSLPKQYLLCVSTLEPRKNLPFLVEAYIELLQDGQVKVPLVLAGRKGWKIDKFINQIEEKYRENIIVTGFIEDEDLPYIYQRANCFVFPSIYEGFGMPPLEALIMGTRVISSDAASLPEVLGDSCSYFSNNDKIELKNAIINISNKPLPKEDMPIEQYIQKYNWMSSAELIWELITRH